jgi:hypothetical protein
VQPKNGAELVIIFKGSYPTGRGRPAKLFGMAVVDRKKTKK